MMRSLMILTPHNTHIVDLVDPHLPRSMDDLVWIQQYAHMRDLPFLIVEKSQVPRLRLLEKTHPLSEGRLLIRIPQHGHT